MTDPRDPDAASDSRKRVAAIERTALRLLAGLFAGIALSAALAVSHYVVGAVLGAVLAALLAGATLGFLFGIPRALTVALPGADGHAGANNGGGFTHNTNLEQISDWLTKIVVGIGLVESQSIGIAFQGLSRQVALEWGLGANGAASAGFVLLASLLFGFIGFYIWTRTAFVYYLEHNETAVAAERRDREAAERRAHQAEADAARAKQQAEQARQQAEQAERDIEAARLRNAEAERQAKEAQAQAEAAARQAEESERQTQEAKKQTQAAQRQSAVYSRMAGYLNSGSIVPLQVLEQDYTEDWLKKFDEIVENPAERSVPSMGIELESDPNLGQFGGAAIARDRELTAQVQPLDADGSAYAITIHVRSLDAAQPLTGKVTIHLHPAFPSAVREVPVVNGEAELRIVASGVFTVGAEADDGATRLELNLANLTNPPAASVAS